MMEKMRETMRSHKKVLVSEMERHGTAKVTGKRDRKEPDHEPTAVPSKRPKGMSRTAYHCCSSILAKLMKDPPGSIFNGLRGSVESRDFELMDFGSVKSNLHGGKYSTVDEFAEDIKLTLMSAMEFGVSLVGERVRSLAREVLDILETERRRFRNDNEKGVHSCSLKPEKIAINETGSGSCLSEVCRSRPDQKRVIGKGDRITESISQSATWSPTTGYDSGEGSQSINTESSRRKDVGREADRRNIEKQRGAARRKMENMKNTAGLTDNIDAMHELRKLLAGQSRLRDT